jgi:hypothetical protein
MPKDEGIPREEQGARQADAERLLGEASRLAARAAGRAREEAEDIWAEAQARRHQEPGVGRRGLIYGIASLINVGERLASAARGAAEGARAAQDEGRRAPDPSPPPVDADPANGRRRGDDRI